MRWMFPISLALPLLISSLAIAQSNIRIDVGEKLKPISKLLTGACIEDVNHEIYGGFYSQMIFGESFQEPPTSPAIRGFSTYGGRWLVKDGVLSSEKSDGSKIVASGVELKDGTASVEVKFSDKSDGNAGFILRTSKVRFGANDFFGYEISLDPGAQLLRLGRHRNNWEHISDTPCNVPLDQWNLLVAKLSGNRIEVLVNGESKLVYEDKDNKGLETGGIGLREWQHAGQYRNFKYQTPDKKAELTWKYESEGPIQEVSGMWQAKVDPQAHGEFKLDANGPFVGTQSQRITYREGNGSLTLQNRSLNRWGMHFQAGKEYEGVLYVKAHKPSDLRVSMHNDDGGKTLAEQSLKIDSTEWKEVKFKLTPSGTAERGSFAISMKTPGDVSVGYASLHPGAWGRYKDLPVRKDVADMMHEQGIRILRYGGSMVNNPEYRWKKMIGPREKRQPYLGFWYKHSTNGWGILDFMNFCEAAGFEYVPTFTMHESAQDMADFIHYAKDPISSEWGAKRSADGHPEPYHLKYLQLGNEERVDAAYAAKFEEMAKQIWALDKDITLVVGDFVYNDRITDPTKITRAASGITNLDGQKRVLQIAKEHNREVWFDIHVWTAGPRPDDSFDTMFTYIDALEKLADGAKFKVLTFEFNSNNHDQRRAIANAFAINAIERDGRLPIATSANCLQPDGQNDNGWDQGLLFLSPSKVWLQPPGYVTQMYANNYCESLVRCDVDKGDDLDCNAKLSSDGKSLVLNVVNFSDANKTITIQLAGFDSKAKAAEWVELAGDMTAKNTEANPNAIVPQKRSWEHTLASGETQATFAPHSVTSIRIR